MPVFNGKSEIMQSGVAHTIADLARADQVGRTKQAGPGKPGVDSFYLIADHRIR